MPGEVVDPDDLNNLVDLALALPPLITDQTSVNATTGDKVLVSRGGVLKQADASTFPQGVVSIAMTATPTNVFGLSVTHPTTDTTIALSLDNQGPHKVLAGPASGTDTGIPSFRVLASADMALPTSLITAGLIDWSLGNVFSKTLPVGATPPNTFSFSNVDDGQTIKVRLKQNAAGDARVNWAQGTPAIIWVGGTEPELPTGVGNSFGIFVFTAVRQSGVTIIHGYLEQQEGITGNTQTRNTFFAGPVSGADATPAFRAITPSDISNIVEITNPTPNVVDCTRGNVFRKILSGAASPAQTLILRDGIPGQRISVYLIQNGSPGTPVTWTSDDPSAVIRWPGGVNHTMTLGIGHTDIVNFFCIGGGQYYGTYDKDFTP